MNDNFTHSQRKVAAASGNAAYSAASCAMSDLTYVHLEFNYLEH
ncbi:hypothetical protein [Acinetobacter sp.]